MRTAKEVDLADVGGGGGEEGRVGVVDDDGFLTEEGKVSNATMSEGKEMRKTHYVAESAERSGHLADALPSGGGQVVPVQCRE